MELRLEKTWRLGQQLGRGGFGTVYRAEADDQEAAVKLVPKAPGAQRELLFVDLQNVRNVVPIIDSGETDDAWVIVMPLATMSLRDHMEAQGGIIGTDEAVGILTDMAQALADLDELVVHRDLKPENVLLLGDDWCLSDFGISRYAEATTAPDTQKYALSPSYAAPERWRSERATSATDIYSFGVVAYELLAGRQPFAGPTMEAYRDQHLHQSPASLAESLTGLAALVEECLYKAPGARPGPANVLARLNRLQMTPNSAGLSRLQEAHRVEVERRAEAAKHESKARTEAERRTALVGAARSGFSRISRRLVDSIVNGAPSATVKRDRDDAWTITLGSGQLSLGACQPTEVDPWKWQPPAFEVLAHAALSLAIPPDPYGYGGRSHSLWFGDAQEPGLYGWYETAYMISPGIAAPSSSRSLRSRPRREGGQSSIDGHGRVPGCLALHPPRR